MRRYLVAGNWKMNLGPAAGRSLAAAVAGSLKGRKLRGDVLVCPPFVTIPAVAAAADGNPLLLGAQNCGDQDGGAFTGEIAPSMLKEAGVSYVIIGHSERRQYQREDDDLLVRKINLLHAAGLKAIFCYGELLAERKAGREREVVRAQLEGVLPRLQYADPYNTVLAYEPVWAIGTGETATPEQAQQMHAWSREVAGRLLGEQPAASLRILYGGSCKASNALDLFSRPDVDGGLIGGASLKVEDFVGIVDGAEASRD
ncbi:MAG: triose-phosphate isomerase [bacterium]|nr:triose-phosphate isomerase [bacterium]